MNFMRLSIWLLLFVFIGCASDPEKTAHVTYEICGRDKNHTPIYRLKAPVSWVIKTPEKNESLIDTKKPLSEFLIQEDDKQIRITIHNFPSKKIDERIPLGAQILRWKQQFDHLDSDTLNVSPQSFAGFTGMLLEACGEMDKKEMTMLGLAMQIAPRHYRRLTNSSFINEIQAEQMRSCYTIKALGDSDLIEKNKKNIINLMKSFELIEEVP